MCKYKNINNPVIREACKKLFHMIAIHNIDCRKYITNHLYQFYLYLHFPFFISHNEQVTRTRWKLFKLDLILQTTKKHNKKPNLGNQEQPESLVVEYPGYWKWNQETVRVIPSNNQNRPMTVTAGFRLFKTTVIDN